MIASNWWVNSVFHDKDTRVIRKMLSKAWRSHKRYYFLQTSPWICVGKQRLHKRNWHLLKISNFKFLPGRFWLINLLLREIFKRTARKWQVKNQEDFSKENYENEELKEKWDWAFEARWNWQVAFSLIVLCHQIWILQAHQCSSS